MQKAKLQIVEIWGFEMGEKQLNIARAYPSHMHGSDCGGDFWRRRLRKVLGARGPGYIKYPDTELAETFCLIEEKRAFFG